MTGLSTSHRFHARLLNDQLVVVDRELGEMRVLNGIASLLWLLLDERPHTLESLAQSCADLLGKIPADIDEMAKSVLEEWRALGWIESLDSGYRIIQLHGAVVDGLRGRGVWHSPQTLIPEHTLKVALPIRLGGKSFKVSLSSTGKAGHPDTLARLQAVLSGMMLHLNEVETIELGWIHDGDAFWLVTPEGVLWTKNEVLAISSVITALFEKAYVGCGMFATLHAAAVSQQGEVVLLPGASGSGKSTLTAYLVAQGWDYLGDDVIALGRSLSGEPFEVLALPTAVGVKSGSWPILRTLYPEIDDLPVVSYADRQAKFLPLKGSADIQDMRTKQSLRVIVLPRYVPGQVLSMTPIDPVRALCELIETGISAGEAINPLRVDMLLELLEDLPIFLLHHGGNMVEVDRTLKGLLQCD